MKARPGLLFTFDDGREIALPCPTAERMAAVFILTPAPGTAETAAQWVQRFIRQVDTLLESAHWISAPPASATPANLGASFTLSQARQLTNAVMAHYLGSDAKTFTQGAERIVAAAGLPELENVRLGDLLTLFSRE